MVPLQRSARLALQLRRTGIALHYGRTLRLLSALNRFAFFLGGGSLLAFPPCSVRLLRAAKKPRDSASALAIAVPCTWVETQW